METPEFLPLGSIVVVQGGTKKLMIISRGLLIPQNGQTSYFDYGGCMYPEGLVGDKLMYFNHDKIQRVVSEGYKDEDETLMLENLEVALKNINVPKGVPGPVFGFGATKN